MAEEFTREGIRVGVRRNGQPFDAARLTGTGVTGKALEALLGQANITVNKNTIPKETLSRL